MDKMTELIGEGYEAFYDMKDCLGYTGKKKDELVATADRISQGIFALKSEIPEFTQKNVDAVVQDLKERGEKWIEDGGEAAPETIVTQQVALRALMSRASLCSEDVGYEEKITLTKGLVHAVSELLEKYADL